MSKVQTAVADVLEVQKAAAERLLSLQKGMASLEGVLKNAAQDARVKQQETLKKQEEAKAKAQAEAKAKAEAAPPVVKDTGKPAGSPAGTPPAGTPPAGTAADAAAGAKAAPAVPDNAAPAQQEARPAAYRPVNQQAPRPQAPRPQAPRPQGQGYQPRPQGDRPQGQGYQPRPQGQGGYQPRPQGDRPQGQGYQPRPQGQGGYQPRPQGQGGYQPRPQAPRPQGQGGYQPRPQGQGGYQPRPQAQGGYQPRPQGQGGYQPRPQGQGGYGARPQGQGGYGARPQGGQGGYGARPQGRAPAVEAPMEKERVSNYDPNKKMYARTHDDKKTPNRKDVMKQRYAAGGIGDDDIRYRGKRVKKREEKMKIEPIVIENVVMTADTISLKSFSEKIGKPVSELIKKLFMLGIMATINNDIDYETASLIAMDYGITVEQKLIKTREEIMTDADEAEENEADLVIRPPVVTVMGHVDHGKTSLLDAIRNTNVTTGEAGGITQHIGAYMVRKNDRDITFLDTPGHEAFTAMRARGAQVTDIAILVVAADDGIMPQTIEAINHAKAAKVSIIVAINKIDKPAANIDKVKQELTHHGLVPEEWGGDAVIVPVSAVTGEGIDNLLEMILLLADVNQYKANPGRAARGAIVEARLDKGRGPVATVLIQNGTLHVGDTIVAGTAFGRVRAMMDDKGAVLKEAGPAMPVEVLGFNDVPDAGDTLYCTDDDRMGKQVAQERKDKIKASMLKAKAKTSLEDIYAQIQEGKLKDLNLIVKADVQGSAEAVKQAMEKISNEEVKVSVIHCAVGGITESDIMLASVSGAIIIGFNVRPDAMARTAAEREEVDVRLYRVIYTAIEDIEAAIKGMLEPEYKDVTIGHAEVRTLFKASSVGTIAGCYVLDGKIQRHALVRLLRDSVVVHEGELSTLRRFKDDAKEVAAGYECGMTIAGYNDLKEGDVIEAYVKELVKR